MTPRKLFAIGDIHGCFDQLLKILDWIENHTEAAQVVFLGDIVDRGYKSSDVITHLRAGPHRKKDRWDVIGGNHDDMMVQAVTKPTVMNIVFWLQHGGIQTLASYGGRGHYTGFAEALKEMERTQRVFIGPWLLEVEEDILKVPNDDIAWLKSLPNFFETECHWFVHAGLLTGTHPSTQSEAVLKWKRNWESLINTDRVPGNERFDDDGKLIPATYAKHVVYGHTVKNDVWQLPHCTGLDTGACFGLKLSAAEFPRNKKEGPQRIIQVDTATCALTVREKMVLA